MHEWIAAFTGLLPAWLAANLEWKQVVLIAMTPIFLLAFGAEWRVMAQREVLESWIHVEIHGRPKHQTPSVVREQCELAV